jgi:hypothetical protein
MNSSSVRQEKVKIGFTTTHLFQHCGLSFQFIRRHVAKISMKEPVMSDLGADLKAITDANNFRPQHTHTHNE